jgi:acyl-coenzyme A synthetase/AMP-(fatty) acid ligase
VLRDHARQTLANFKVPKRFVLMDELPRLKNDKIDRLALRTEAARLIAADTSRPSRNLRDRGGVLDEK